MGAGECISGCLEGMPFGDDGEELCREMTAKVSWLIQAEQPLGGNYPPGGSTETSHFSSKS